MSHIYKKVVKTVEAAPMLLTKSYVRAVTENGDDWRWSKHSPETITWMPHTFDWHEHIHMRMMERGELPRIAICDQ